MRSDIPVKYTPTVKPLEWVGDALKILDQTKLPLKEEYIVARDHETVARAIETMQVRGAPAIGIAAAYGVVLAAKNIRCSDAKEFLSRLRQAIDRLASTRPTAVNLFWALKRMSNVAEKLVNEGVSIKEVIDALEDEAKSIHEEEFEAELKMSYYGAQLLEDGCTVLTHCNAGGLATGTGLGTALGVIKIAKHMGKDIRVIATETRPVLQGARLTVYELVREGIDTTLITDNMVGYVMYRGMVDAVIVGADRILADGHVINKIGTYTISVLARQHNVPFYVAAPKSTFDLETPVEKVVIEERDPEEVRTVFGGCRITLENVKVFNPAFDITPPSNVTAIVTEYGVIYPPFRLNIRRVIPR